MLPQDTYRLEHAARGKFALRLSPIGSRNSERTGRYEAIINRLYL